MGDFFGILFVVLLVGFFYFMPLGFAIERKHKDVTAIGVLNLFLGWTFLGWVIALVWALKKS